MWPKLSIWKGLFLNNFQVNFLAKRTNRNRNISTIIAAYCVLVI